MFCGSILPKSLPWNIGLIKVGTSDDSRYLKGPLMFKMFFKTFAPRRWNSGDLKWCKHHTRHGAHVKRGTRAEMQLGHWTLNSYMLSDVGDHEPSPSDIEHLLHESMMVVSLVTESKVSNERSQCLTNPCWLMITRYPSGDFLGWGLYYLGEDWGIWWSMNFMNWKSVWTNYWKEHGGSVNCPIADLYLWT